MLLSNVCHAFGPPWGPPQAVGTHDAAEQASELVSELPAQLSVQPVSELSVSTQLDVHRSTVSIPGYWHLSVLTKLPFSAVLD